jgi:hypothetical protein
MQAHLLFGQSARRAGAKRPPEYTFKIIRVFPHDGTAEIRVLDPQTLVCDRKVMAQHF